MGYFKVFDILLVAGLGIFVSSSFYGKGFFSEQAIYGLLLMIVYWISNIERKLKEGKNGRE